MRLDRQSILVRHLGIAGIGKGRKIGMTRWSYPLFQGFQEFFIRPAADAGFRIACNIRCIENPERGFQRPPTGEWLAGPGSPEPQQSAGEPWHQIGKKRPL